MRHAELVSRLGDWSRRTRALLDELDRVTAPRSARGETLTAWFSRWNSVRAKRVSRPHEERRTFALWIEPRLGRIPMAAITRSDLESWVEWIDDQVVARKLQWGTAVRIWSDLRAMMRDASGAKIRALRVRTDNPAAGVRPPDRHARRASTFLYPSEFVRLMECRKVPLGFRRLYACAVYLYPRSGELKALEWSDLELRSGLAHIHRSIDREGSSGRTKTETDRQFAMERKLLPLLRRMRDDGAGERLFPRIPQRHNLARNLRVHLRQAGCRRADLHASDEGRRPLTFHDLRATGITWQAMRGDSPHDIRERVGHAHLATTELYIRRGRLLAKLAGERPFPVLPPAVLGGRKRSKKRR